MGAATQNAFTEVRWDDDSPGEERTVVLIPKQRSVTYGPEVRARIDLIDEDETVQLEHHEDRVLAVHRLKGRKGTFLTVGSEHAMHVWYHYGRHIAELKGHTDRVRGVWNLNGDRVMTLGSDKTIRLWDAMRGVELCAITTAVESPSDGVLIAGSSDHLCLMEPSGARLVSFDGDEVAVLEKQVEPLKAYVGLDSGGWLTVDAMGPRMWSAGGKLLRRFDESFSLADGYLELEGGGLLIVCADGTSLRVSARGVVESRRRSDPDLAARLRRFIGRRTDTTQWIREHPSYRDFRHRNNPRSKPFIATEVLEDLDIKEKVWRRTEPIWSFFNRPDFKAIRTARRAEIAATRDDLEALSASEEADREEAQAALAHCRLAFWGLAAAVLLTFVGLAGTPALAILGPIAAIGALMVAINNGRLHQRIIEGAGAIKPFEAVMLGLIQETKAHRRKVIAQVPITRDHGTYDGRIVQRLMDAVVTGRLEKLALSECGISRSDIIFPGQTAIRLRDWSGIQDRSDLASAKIKGHNERAFWWDRDGRVYFAVQFVQYVFLTADKLDVFTVYYDFILDQAIEKSAHSFYYKDVTNISKRDVERVAPIESGTEDPLEATEIVMAVSSGERIHLTVLNEDSVTDLKRRALGEQVGGASDVVEELEEEIEKARRDPALGDEERKLELAALEGFLADARAQQFVEEASPFASRAEEAVENIRTQIRRHKRDGR